MRVIDCRLENFASYKSLQFYFDEQGLCLIQGPTGSGKSTLCDAIPWILFGRTAKDGAVDEVRSWGVDMPTTGELIIQVKGIRYLVRRSRNPSDLYWQLYKGTPQRGKDLNDTQRILNSLLEFDVNTYLAGAYFHEFSQTAQFFTTTAKNRRVLCEQLVDLSKAKTLQTNLGEKKKELAKEEQTYAQKIQLYADRAQQLDHNNFIKLADNFEVDKQKTLLSIGFKIASKLTLPADYLKEAIQTLEKSTTCDKCGSHIHSRELAELKREEYANNSAIAAIENLKFEFEKEKSKTNHYGDLEAKRLKDIENAETNLVRYSDLHSQTEVKLADIELLSQVVNDFRSVSIKNTISQLEHQTNRLLTEHFDGEIRVMFEVEAADKLDVTITKDGNICSYTQLSKGQRQLLKLCFGISVMRAVANRYGTSFNAIFLDEALDGLDDQLKAKALGLFRTMELEYGSIFVVDHSSELKAAFEKSFKVELINGGSNIEKA